MTIYTSKAYLNRFYELNCLDRVNSSAAVKLWRKLNDTDKERIYKSITKGININAFDWLNEQLKDKEMAKGKTENTRWYDVFSNSQIYITTYDHRLAILDWRIVITDKKLIYFNFELFRFSFEYRRFNDGF